MGVFKSLASVTDVVVVVVVVSLVLVTLAGEADGRTVLFSAVVRDFSVDHTDFERYGGGGVDCGAVEDELGEDRKPIMWGGKTATGKFLDRPCPQAGTGRPRRVEYFQNFFRDVPGVNIRIPIQLKFEEQPPGSGIFVFDRNKDATGINQYFPVDGLGWGADVRRLGFFGNVRNFLFTTEIHAEFVYRGDNEFFNFAGDDDVWVFVNNKLVVDVGGLHSQRTGAVNLTNIAGKLGLVPGERYPVFVGIAERHSTQSNCRIETTLAPINRRPSTQPAAYSVKVGENVTVEFVAFDEDGDNLVYTHTIPDELALLLDIAPDSQTARFHAPDSLDLYLPANETSYTFSMEFTVSDGEYTACPSTVTITVTRTLVAPSPPAATPAPTDNTTTVVIISIVAVLAVIGIIALIALIFYVRSQAETWKAEIMAEFADDNLSMNPLYTGANTEFSSPLYDDGGGDSVQMSHF
ncbi:fibro-slime family protein [Thecamonas trahens ATCC 50062]|uniref:Fibro-slime family protein n=1 Tax=Thecamonas trahens ATCC 50062 TaxID=461836 RepID=A0A0L0DH31_THETB|nr:fibro-slime family protein [Thecamonas trahens ATCC 50062]KNC51446.1 fibro-slime family protein [Thecamonas trahens ATCC 50062]|eukprot:XP_013756108.1 fibro-slime family protein [Thecamonas trahens ATCC 50062]